MVEETEQAEAGKVRIRSAVEPGTAVRPAGGDLAAGTVVFGAGTRLTAHHLGVLASIGVSAPLVRRRPVVAVLSTGDEVMPVDTAVLPPGRIRDANRPMLVGMLADLGATVVDLGIVPDDARLLRATLEEASGAADAVVTSGGVSMGDYDLVKQVLGDLGRIDFWQVAMQPAKPFAFGFLGETPLFGLPGNPVSVTVAFEQFVRPALLTRMGADRVFRPRVAAVLGHAVDTNPEKAVFLRVALTRRGERLVATSTGGQASNVLSALAAADGFAVIPVGTGGLDAGEAVEVELFRAAETRTASELLG
jgi:molybdopterin molybdotransferase